MLPVRISAVTLACHDIGRMAAFYRQFGWPETRGARAVLRGGARAAVRPPRGRVSWFTLTIHCEDEDAVFRAHEEIGKFDDLGDLDEQPQRSGWGCGFSFRDPEGNVWDVAFKHGSDFDHRGGFIYP